MLHNIGVSENRYVESPGTLGRFDTVRTEATWQTRHDTETRLEALGLVMRDVVLKYLNHCYPSLRLVCNLGLATQSHNFRVLNHGRYHARQRVREHLGVCIHHENNFIVFWRYTRYPPNCVEELVLELRHALVEKYLLHECHQNHL